MGCFYLCLFCGMMLMWIYDMMKCKGNAQLGDLSINGEVLRLPSALELVPCCWSWFFGLVTQQVYSLSWLVALVARLYQPETCSLVGLATCEKRTPWRIPCGLAGHGVAGSLGNFTWGHRSGSMVIPPRAHRFGMGSAQRVYRGAGRF